MPLLINLGVFEQLHLVIDTNIKNSRLYFMHSMCPFLPNKHHLIIKYLKLPRHVVYSCQVVSDFNSFLVCV